LIEGLAAAAAATVEHRITMLTSRSITARLRFLTGQLADIDPDLARLIQAHPAGPALLAEPGVGAVVAAQLLVSWSHPGRVRNEAAFPSLAGVAPLEASSGQRTRHRLDRGGDRAPNRALHAVAITRLRCHAKPGPTKARRPLQGKTHRDVRCCLKCTLARHLYRVMESTAAKSPAPGHSWQT
jgi:transposase